MGNNIFDKQKSIQELNQNECGHVQVQVRVNQHILALRLLLLVKLQQSAIETGIREGYIFKKCLSPGSNRGPLVCETSVITDYTTQTVIFIFWITS